MTVLDHTRGRADRLGALSAHLSGDPVPDPRQVPVDVEIVVPVYNEAPLLAERIVRLRQFLDESFPFRATVTVVDNASTDATYAVACEVAASTPGVAAMHLRQKGKGLALRSAWSTSIAPVVAYMDVDLSTSLTALLPLVAPLIYDHRDVAIGTRLAPGARVVRGTKRELISRAYNLTLKVCLRGRFSDAQCGFKAMRRDIALQLLPLVKDDEWFFDTELLITAERLGLRMSEVPVDWIDDPDSRVNVLQTAIRDLRGVWRISHGEALKLVREAAPKRSTFDEVPADELLRFAGVGLLSTVVYLFLFLAGRTAMGSIAGNLVALAICTLFNTAIHRELSRNLPIRRHQGRVMAMIVGLFSLSAVLTTVALVLTQLIDPSSLALTLAGVTVANGLASILRFAVLRNWLFQPTPSAPMHSELAGT
jgi:glycosyltransferase involved in cell wall biosynthesis